MADLKIKIKKNDSDWLIVESSKFFFFRRAGARVYIYLDE